jgi:hypothetical protein
MSRSRRRAQELDTQVAGTTDLLRQLLQCVRTLACRAAGSGFLVRAKMVTAPPGATKPETAFASLAVALQADVGCRVFAQFNP